MRIAPHVHLTTTTTTTKMTGLTLTTRFLLLFSALLCTVTSQEEPFYKTPMYTANVTHRQSFCRIYNQIQAGNITWKNALKDVKLHVALYRDHLDNVTGVIKEREPNIGISMMDEWARRAGFKWRDTYGAVYKTGSDNETSEMFLDYSVSSYDVFAQWHIRTPERIVKGWVFPEGWFDASLVMISHRVVSGPQFDWTIFLSAFSVAMWFVVFVSMAVSGVSYHAVDYLDSFVNGMEMESGFMESLFMAAFAITGQALFKPRSVSKRIISSAVCFFCMLTVSFYFAGLANLLIVTNDGRERINDLGDAFALGKTVCVDNNSMGHRVILNEYPESEPHLVLVNKYNIGLEKLGKECDIYVTFMDKYREYKVMNKYNPDCTMEWVGRKIKHLVGGFVLKDSPELCSNVIRESLTSHMTEMIADGTVEYLWKSFLSKSSDTSCRANTRTLSLAEGVSLSISDVNGIFFLYLIILAVVIILSTLRFLLLRHFKPHLKDDTPDVNDAAVDNLSHRPEDTTPDALRTSSGDHNLSSSGPEEPREETNANNEPVDDDTDPGTDDTSLEIQRLYDAVVKNEKLQRNTRIKTLMTTLVTNVASQLQQLQVEMEERERERDHLHRKMMEMIDALTIHESEDGDADNNDDDAKLTPSREGPPDFLD